MFAYIMEGFIFKDRYGMLVVIRNVFVIMEELDIIYVFKGNYFIVWIKKKYFVR